jgi:hypothetical protein
LSGSTPASLQDRQHTSSISNAQEYTIPVQNTNTCALLQDLRGDMSLLLSIAGAYCGRLLLPAAS